MRQGYQIKLNDLADQGAQMCQIAASALQDATEALLTADLALAQDVIALGVAVDGMRSSAEASALRILALEAPVATDLRRVLTALWIVSDVQRMSTLAIHVAQAARRRHPAQVVPEPVRPIFQRMGHVGVHLAEQAGQVLRERNVDLAVTMQTQDDLMDDLHREMFAAVLAATWPHGVGAAVEVSLLSRFYERFADHAVAVAQRVVFLVTGENPARHPAGGSSKTETI